MFLVYGVPLDVETLERVRKVLRDLKINHLPTEEWLQKNLSEWEALNLIDEVLTYLSQQFSERKNLQGADTLQDIITSAKAASMVYRYEGQSYPQTDFFPTFAANAVQALNVHLKNTPQDPHPHMDHLKLAIHSLANLLVRVKIWW